MDDLNLDAESGEWSRRTDDYLLGVSASPMDLDEVGVARGVGNHLEPSWTVSVSMAEFIREEPLAGEMRSLVDRALRSVSGVGAVWEEDTEVWALTGEPDGERLVTAVAEAVDLLADRARAHEQSFQSTKHQAPGRRTRFGLGWRRR